MKFMNKKGLLIFISIFLLIFCINYFVIPVSTDEIWTYGFSRNIADGLLPYRDYNMVIFPFQSFFNAFFMLIFGNSLLSWHLVNAFLYSIVLYLVIDKIGFKKGLFLILVMISFEVYFYNIFLCMCLVLILLLNDSKIKLKDLYIGLLVGAMMMTKANVGAFIFLVFFLTSKNKLNAFLYSAIIPFITLCYLLISNTFYDFFDQTILGIGNFKNVNSRHDTGCYFLVGLTIIYIIYKIIKTKDKNYYYFLAFMMICYPICDYNHFVEALWPLLTYSFMKIKNSNNIKLVYVICVFVASFYFTTYGINYTNYKECKMLGYRNFYGKDMLLFEIEKYISENPDKNYYFMLGYTYIVKYDKNLPFTKYDNMNSGNMGKDDFAYLSYLKKECKYDSCRIIIKKGEFFVYNSQFRKEYLDYILDYFEPCYEDYVYCKKKLFCTIEERK